MCVRARASVRAHTRIVRGCPSSAVFAACHALDAQERGDVREAAAAPLSSSCPSFQHHLGLVSHPPRLFSSPSGGPLSCVLKGIGPKASGEKCQRATQLLPERRRGAYHLCSFSFCIFFFGLSSWTDSPGRTAAKGLDEPPLSHPEMELLLLCLSLWILQYNSAKTDSIIHIGKHQNKTIK